MDTRPENDIIDRLLNPGKEKILSAVSGLIVVVTFVFAACAPAIVAAAYRWGF